MTKDSEIKEFAFADLKTYKSALEKAPSKKWVKSRSLGGNKTSNYIPLYIQQALAEKFFREFYVVEEKYNVIANEILCTVKLQIVPDFPYADTIFPTGTAAKPIQQDSGISASSFPTGKKINALEYNAPAARSAAISNALTSIGNIFGRNLNREANNDFTIKGKEEKNAE
jgi:hypothetical protein